MMTGLVAIVSTTALLGAASPNATVLENARVLTGTGAVMEHASVRIENGIITAIGTSVKLDGATRIDCSDSVITPGFIEVNTQLTLSEIGLEKTTVDSAPKVQAPSPAFRAADGVQPLSPRVGISREEGVTSVVVSPQGTLLYGQAYWLDLLGTLASRPNPKNPIAMFGGLSGSTHKFYGARGEIWMTLRGIVADARFYRANKAKFDNGATRPLALAPMQLEAMLPVLDGKMPLVLEVNRASDILAALEFVREEGIKLVIVGGAEAWLVAKELALAKVPVVLHPSLQMPDSFDALQARDDSATLLATASVPLIISAGDEDQNVRRLRQEAGIAVARGLPYPQAITAISERPARVFGRNDLGTIAVGQRADIVVWSRDPLELSSVAKHVFIAGKAQDLMTRQKLLAKKYLK